MISGSCVFAGRVQVSITRSIPPRATARRLQVLLHLRRGGEWVAANIGGAAGCPPVAVVVSGRRLAPGDSCIIPPVAVIEVWGLGDIPNEFKRAKNYVNPTSHACGRGRARLSPLSSRELSPCVHPTFLFSARSAACFSRSRATLPVSVPSL